LPTEEPLMTDDTTDDAELASTYDADAADIEYMFAQTARELGVAGGRLTLHGAAASTLWFSDRPQRLTGHLPTSEFVANWDVGDDSFAADPPNGLLSIFEDDAVNDVVVVLRQPRLDGDDLSYSFEVTEGELAPSTGPTSLFIDTIGRPLSPGSVAGVRRRGGRRGRRRMRRRVR